MQIDLDWRQYNVPEWNGVTCSVRPLEAWAYQQAMRVLQKHGTTGKEGEAKSGNMDFFADDGTREAAERILKDHVKALAGVDLRVDGKTRAAEVVDLTKFGPLFPVALTVMAHLISISTLTETEAGNSDARRDNS